MLSQEKLFKFSRIVETFLTRSIQKEVDMYKKIQSQIPLIAFHKGAATYTFLETGDIYEFCSRFPNLDHVFASAEQWLFGCQPSLEFSRALPQKFWSEAFHMGYFAYYPMIFATAILPLTQSKARFAEYSFIILATFLLYYVIYLFLPVAGPQYYFAAIGEQAAEAGNFTAVGDYFRTHLEMRPSPGPEGFFRSCVESAQAGGERPQAAFPSSHVGVSTVLMILLWRLRNWAFVCILPFYVLLCCATVYIEAHYAIDVIGGFVSAVVFYFLTKKAYDCWIGSAEGAI
jgi:membrane-associated phospholipid phosphatase